MVRCLTKVVRSLTEDKIPYGMVKCLFKRLHVPATSSDS